MKQLDSQEIKEELFHMLCHFAAFCDEQGLQYFLCAGTLLGAIRHQDFIPWDDDVDLLMPRPDYMKLVQLYSNSDLSDRYFFTGYEFGNYELSFLKMVDRKIIVQKELSSNDHNLWIDIFPIDGLPKDIKKQNQILDRAAKLRRMVGFSYARIGTGKSITKAILKIPAVLYCKAIGKQKLVQEIHDLATSHSYEDAEEVAELSWCCGRNECFKKKDFMVSEDVLFHGRYFHAPKCWDAYLTRLYGDYMEIPPVPKQRDHSMNVFLID